MPEASTSSPYTTEAKPLGPNHAAAACSRSPERGKEIQMAMGRATTSARTANDQPAELSGGGLISGPNTSGTPAKAGSGAAIMGLREAVDQTTRTLPTRLPGAPGLTLTADDWLR